MTKRVWIIIAVTVVALVALPIILMAIYKEGPDTVYTDTSSSSPAGNEPVAPVPDGPVVTVEGILVCLPHKDTTGPQTAECAYGLQDDTGIYYGLRDTTSDYSLIMGVPMNVRVRVTGVEEPEASQKYQSTKKIHMSALEKLQ